MDTDLMTLWLHAEYLSKDEARDLITELQTARDDAARDDDLSKEDARELQAAAERIVVAFDELSQAGVDDFSEKVGALGTEIDKVRS